MSELSWWMGELSWVSTPEAAALFYLQICSVQNAEAAQETAGDASPPAIPPPDVFANPISSFAVCFCQRLPALFIRFAEQCHGFNRRGG